MTPSHLPTGTVTFLFTDIEGSTRLLGELGDGFNRLIEDHNRLLSEAFRDGHVVRTEGDAFFVVFPTASPALAAAATAQRALAAHDWGEGTTVKVRMGLHTGEGVIAGGDYAGLDVHRAARIAAAGHGGQVLLSETTRALVQGSLAEGLSTRDLGEHRLKDIPDPEHLYQLVIQGLPADFPAPRTLDARPGNLTMRLTPFIGREPQLADVKSLCAENRLVTLTGPGGTGKTRLSLQVAMDLLDTFQDGAWFVYLAPITEPELVPSTIATTLDVMEEPDRPLMATLKDHLCDKQTLLVLDNFEQIVGAAPLVAELLDAAPGLKCIVTSREVLHVSGEQEYPVPPMSLPDPKRLPPDPETLEGYESVALFLQRARAVRPDYSLTREDAPAVAEICYRLDGLPLAIELAASRVRVLTPQRIIERLEPVLPMLTGGARDLPARQQTLRNTIGWSFDLLDEPERAFFRRFAAFAGGCSFEAAEMVCNPDAELGPHALDLLESLVDKSLLRRFEDDGETRLRMLHVIREYAAERLEESEEALEIRRRHAGFYLEMARTSQPELFGTDQAMWLDRLEAEHDNFRAALDWAVEAGEAEIALRLGGALWRFWQMRGHFREAWDRLTKVLGMPDTEQHPEARAEALEGAGGVAYWMGETPGAQELYRNSLELRRQLPDEVARARAAYNLACTYVFFVDYRKGEEAVELLEEAERIFRERNETSGLADVLWAAGGNLFTLGRYEEGLPALEESLELYRQAGNRFGEAWAMHMLGLAEIMVGRLDDARRHFEEALDIFVGSDDRSAIPLLVGDFALIETKRGDGERALRLAGAAEALGKEWGVGITSWADEAMYPVLEEMRSLLPEEERERLQAEGGRMTPEEAIAYARKTEA